MGGSRGVGRIARERRKRGGEEARKGERIGGGKVDSWSGESSRPGARV